MPDRQVKVLSATPTVVQLLGDPGSRAGQLEGWTCSCRYCPDCIRRQVFLHDLERAWAQLEREWS